MSWYLGRQPRNILTKSKVARRAYMIVLTILGVVMGAWGIHEMEQQVQSPTFEMTQEVYILIGLVVFVAAMFTLGILSFIQRRRKRKKALKEFRALDRKEQTRRREEAKRISAQVEEIQAINRLAYEGALMLFVAAFVWFRGVTLENPLLLGLGVPFAIAGGLYLRKFKRAKISTGHSPHRYINK